MNALYSINKLSLILVFGFALITSFGCDIPWDKTTESNTQTGINGSWHGTATQTHSSDTTDQYTQGPDPVIIHFTFAQTNNTFTGTGYSQEYESPEKDGFSISDGTINGNSFSFTIRSSESESYDNEVYTYTTIGTITGTINGNTATGTFEETGTLSGPDGQSIYTFGGNFTANRQ